MRVIEAPAEIRGYVRCQWADKYGDVDKWFETRELRRVKSEDSPQDS